MTRPTRPTIADLENLELNMAALTDAVQRLEEREILDPVMNILESTPTPVIVAPWASLRKALLAGIGTTIAALGTALLDGDLTQTEAYAAGGAGLFLLAGVFRVPNAEVPADA